MVCGSRPNTNSDRADVQNAGNLEFQLDTPNAETAESPFNPDRDLEVPLTELEFEGHMLSSHMDAPPPNSGVYMAKSKGQNKRPVYDGQQTLWEYLVQVDYR